MADAKTYVGKGKKIGQFGMIKISFKSADMKPNGKGWCNLVVGEMRQPDQYGNTHTVWLDTWRPNQGQNQSVPNNGQEDVPPPENW